MAIPTELVGSLPRPMKLQEAYEAYDQGQIGWAELQAEQDAAAEDSIRRLEEIGRADRHRRRAARVELRDLPDHRHARRAPAWPTTSPATASSSRSSTTATTASSRA